MSINIKRIAEQSSMIASELRGIQKSFREPGRAECYLVSQNAKRIHVLATSIFLAHSLNLSPGPSHSICVVNMFKSSKQKNINRF